MKKNSYEKTGASVENSNGYRRTQMQKDIIIKRLKERGCRITRQRMMLLDVILADEYTCCKEIYYRVAKLDSGIGSATVYRMINLLEDIGAITRNNMYRVACCQECKADLQCRDAVCRVILDSGREVILSEDMWKDVLNGGLEACGYISGEKVDSVSVRPGGETACDNAGNTTHYVA